MKLNFWNKNSLLALNFFYSNFFNQILSLKICHPKFCYSNFVTQILSLKFSHSNFVTQIMQPEKNRATSPHTKIVQPLHTQNHETSQQKISHNLSTKKIMQPLHKKSLKLSTKKITQPLHTKNHATSPHKKNHPTSRKINHAAQVSEWVDATSLHTKITQPLHTKKNYTIFSD